MRTALIAVSVGVLGALLVGATPASVTTTNPVENGIENGSFEAPVVAPGTYQLLSTGSSFAGWKVTGASGNVGPISGSYKYEDFSFPAGTRALALTGPSHTKS